MNPTQSQKIINKLIHSNNLKNANNPGYLQNLYRHPDTLCALHVAHTALGHYQTHLNIENNLPENSGKLWSKSEENQIIELFDKDKTVRAIAKRIKRTESAVEARLVMLGKIDG